MLQKGFQSVSKWGYLEGDTLVITTKSDPKVIQPKFEWQISGQFWMVTRVGWWWLWCVLAITGTLEISMDWWSLTMTTKQPDDHETTRWNKKPGDSQNCQRVFTSEFEQWLWVKTYFMLEGSIGSLGSSWKRLSTALKPFVFWKRIHPWKVTLEPKKNNQAEN